MKTILYILIALMVGSIFLSSIPMSALNSNKTITLQCTEAGVSKKQLSTSAYIIKNRLEGVGIKDAVIEWDVDASSIQVKFSDSTDLEIATDLLIAKGKLEIYETYDRKLVLEQLEKDDSLYILMDVPGDEQNGVQEAILGYCSAENILKVENYISGSLKKLTNMRNMEFVWSKVPVQNNEFALYLLKKTPAMHGMNITSVRGTLNNYSGNTDIFFSFGQENRLKWQEVTEANINKALAIVFDDAVYSAPVVQQVIRGGNCMISGDFDSDQANKLVSILKYGELPLKLEITE